MEPLSSDDIVSSQTHVDVSMVLDFETGEDGVDVPVLLESGTGQNRVDVPMILDSQRGQLSPSFRRSLLIFACFSSALRRPHD